MYDEKLIRSLLSDTTLVQLIRQGKTLQAARYIQKRTGTSLSMGLVITIFLVFILGAATLPTAFSQWFNATTTGWPTATQTLWPLVPLLGVVALNAIIAYKAQHKGQG